MFVIPQYDVYFNLCYMFVVSQLIRRRFQSLLYVCDITINKT